MLPRPRLDWRSAATFLVADPAWRTKVLVGGLLLLFPPLGWPAALGYRKVLIGRLATRAEPLLPEWRGNVLRYWLEGMKACGVIFGYYAPLYAWLAVAWASGGPPALPWVALGGVFAYFVLLTPLSLPVLAVLSSTPFGGQALSGAELTAMLTAHAALTFVIPAGFLQVSRTGRYLAAFRLLENLRLVRRHARLYVEAWVYSGLTALIGHACLPLAPWGVFWCYQSIVYSFNEVRLHTGEEADRVLREGDTWYAVFHRQGPRPGFWEHFATERRALWEAYRPRPESPVREAFAVLRLGDLRAPLPGAIARWLPL